MYEASSSLLSLSRLFTYFSCSTFLLHRRLFFSHAPSSPLRIKTRPWRRRGNRAAVTVVMSSPAAGHVLAVELAKYERRSRGMTSWVVRFGSAKLEESRERDEAWRGLYLRRSRKASSERFLKGASEHLIVSTAHCMQRGGL